MSEAVQSNPLARRWNWLKIALVASLAVNMLFAGAAAARFVMGDAPVRFAMLSQVQLVPRKFLGELDGDRRRELLDVIRPYNKTFREGRQNVRAEITAIADALEAEPYDAARVTAAVNRFSAESVALVNEGGQAALDMFARLSPGERTLLAKHLRLRGKPAKAEAKPEAP
jgi:uncharacterized membrane protein